MTERKKNWHGMNWIRAEKRLAIYMRDGFACAYCGHSVEDGAQLALDHVKPHSKGGENGEKNLVTCCCRCNSSRADRSVQVFAKALASYLNHGINPADIVKHVRECVRRPLPKAEAKELIRRRGTVAKVLAKLNRR